MGVCRVVETTIDGDVEWCSYVPPVFYHTSTYILSVSYYERAPRRIRAAAANAEKRSTLL